MLSCWDSCFCASPFRFYLRSSAASLARSSLGGSSAARLGAHPVSARVRSSKHGWGSSASPTAPAKILRILPLLELCLVLEQVLPGYLGNRPVSRTHGRVASCRYVVEKTRGRPERPSCPTRGRLRGGQCGSRRGQSQGRQRFFLLCGRSHLSFTAQKAKSPG